MLFYAKCSPHLKSDIIALNFCMMLLFYISLGRTIDMDGHMHVLLQHVWVLLFTISFINVYK